MTNKLTTEIFESGDKKAIRTSCQNEIEFLNDYSELLMDQATSAGGTYLELLTDLLPQVVDICCKFRGYKSNVDEYTIISAGDRVVSDVVLASSKGVPNPPPDYLKAVENEK